MEIPLETAIIVISGIVLLVLVMAWCRTRDFFLCCCKVSFTILLIIYFEFTEKGFTFEIARSAKNSPWNSFYYLDGSGHC